MISNSLSHTITSSFLPSPAINDRQQQGERSISSSSASPNSSSLLISSNAAPSIKPVGASPSTQQTGLNQGGRRDTTEQTVVDQREAEEAVKQRQEDQQAIQDQRLISELSARDREVRAHEQAHAAVGGQYAGAPSYDFQRGPDGVNYAVGGEVPIDVGRAATPEATIQKAQTVRRAALAPAEPSPQDRNVAAQATRLESQARVEITVERLEAEAEESEREDAVAATDTQSSAQNTDSSNTANRENVVNSSANNTGSAIPSSESSSNVFPLSTQVSQAIANTQTNPNRPGALLSQIV